MPDFLSVPRLVYLLSESLLREAPSDSREQQKQARYLSRLAYSTLLGLNQVNVPRLLLGSPADTASEKLMYLRLLCQT